MSFFGGNFGLFSLGPLAVSFREAIIFCGANEKIATQKNLGVLRLGGKNLQKFGFPQKSHAEETGRQSTWDRLFSQKHTENRYGLWLRIAFKDVQFYFCYKL